MSEQKFSDSVNINSRTSQSSEAQKALEVPFSTDESKNLKTHLQAGNIYLGSYSGIGLKNHSSKIEPFSSFRHYCQKSKNLGISQNQVVKDGGLNFEAIQEIANSKKFVSIDGDICAVSFVEKGNVLLFSLTGLKKRFSKVETVQSKIETKTETKAKTEAKTEAK